jgi:STAS domain
VIIDLAGVSYMDSSGLALFVDAFQWMQCYGGRIALAGVRENVRELFQIVRLDQIFPIYPDRTSALKALGKVNKYQVPDSLRSLKRVPEGERPVACFQKFSPFSPTPKRSSQGIVGFPFRQRVSARSLMEAPSLSDRTPVEYHSMRTRSGPPVGESSSFCCS